jgi:hypothetical protein
VRPRARADGGVAAANVLALVTDLPADGLTAVNVCSGELHTVGDLACTLAAATRGPEPVIVRRRRAGGRATRRRSPARARSLLGFRPEVGFAAGVRAFATAPLRAPARRSTSPNGKRPTPVHRAVAARRSWRGRGSDVVPEIILPCLDEADPLPVVMAALPAG